VVDGDELVITGQKRWTGNAKAADFIQLLCRVADPEPGQPRSRGLATVIVEKERDSFPEGLAGEVIDKIGYHGFLTWNLTFDGLRIPAEPQAPSRRAEEGRGAFRAVEQGLNVARVHTAARAVGLARGAVEDCITYAQERVQFEH